MRSPKLSPNSHEAPPISAYARPCPLSVSPHVPARRALSLMNKLGYHYLPVQSGKRVVGLVCDNRIRAALTAKTRAGLRVSDLMLKSPTVVSPEASLYEVLDELPESARGYTVLQNASGKVTGVFTPNDAIFAFQSLLHGKKSDAAA